MSTDELERLLETALHEADDVPVDVPRGRVLLVQRQREQRRSTQRWAVAAAAAAVLAVVAATSIALGVLRDRDESLPVEPSPGITLSPSGLPVGLLTGKIERTEPQAESTVRMVVRPDGTGVWNAGTVGDPGGDSVTDYEVRFADAGPGRAVIQNVVSACYATDVLILDFTVRGRVVVIEDVSHLQDCFINFGLGSDLVGARLRILPLPEGG